MWLVKGDYQLTIVAVYPNNEDFYIRGNALGLNWNTGVQMTQTSSNSYSIELDFTDSDVGSILEVKVLVNDQIWMIGNNAQILLPSKSVTVPVFPFFYTSKGQYGYIRNIFSPQLNNYRDLVVYTPPSYYENTLKKNYPVLYMHDGQNLFNDSTAFGGNSWRCQDTVNVLVNEGAMDEIIIVGIDNTPDRIDELTYSYDPTVPGGGKGNLYLDFIRDTVMPLITNTYRISTDVADRGILGSSLGGLISCYAGWTRAEYTKVGCMSSSFWWNSEDFNTQILAKTAAFKNAIIYLDSGNQGPDNDDEQQTITVRDHIEQYGWTINNTLFYYLDNGGQHNEIYWRNRFWIPMSDLFPYPVLTP